MAHFYRRFGGFASFVAGRSACAVESILQIVNRQNAENHRSVAVGVEGRNALRDTLANIVEMGCAAANDASEVNVFM